MLFRFSYSAYLITDVMGQKRDVTTANHASNFNQEGNKVKDSLYLIRTAAIRYVILISIWIVLLLIGALEYLKLYKQSWPKGGVLYFVLFFDVGFFLPVLAMFCILLYLHQLGQSRSSRIISQKITNNIIIDPKREPKSSQAFPSGAVALSSL